MTVGLSNLLRCGIWLVSPCVCACAGAPPRTELPTLRDRHARSVTPPSAEDFPYLRFLNTLLTSRDWGPTLPASADGLACASPPESAHTPARASLRDSLRSGDMSASRLPAFLRASPRLAPTIPSERSFRSFLRGATSGRAAWRTIQAKLGGFGGRRIPASGKWNGKYPLCRRWKRRPPPRRPPTASPPTASSPKASSPLVVSVSPKRSINPNNPQNPCDNISQTAQAILDVRARCPDPSRRAGRSEVVAGV